MRVWPVLAAGVAAWTGGVSAAAAQTHVIVVEGLGGEARYREAFAAWAATLLEAADRLGVPDDHLVHLRADRPADDPLRSTRENVERALRTVAARAEPQAAVVIVLIGHGSAAAGPARFNLPGPDMTAEDFAALLAGFVTQQVAFVNLASASGGFVPVLSGPRRLVVAATRSEREQLETVFGGYFVAAFAQAGADTDHDDRVSLLEAFAYARAEVARDYERRGVLLTEHAVLDDDGDGRGTLEPGSAGGDGARAGLFFLASEPAAVATSAPQDSVLRALLLERERLEADLSALRARRDAMAPSDYEAELERLLLALARTGRAIREREGGDR